MKTDTQPSGALPAVKVGDTWYRYEDRRYGVFDEFEHLSYSYVRVVEYPYDVEKVTPKGVWLTVGCERRFVLNAARKKYAAPTREEALASYLARKERQARLLQAQLKGVEEGRRLGREQLAALKLAKCVEAGVPAEVKCEQCLWTGPASSVELDVGPEDNDELCPECASSALTALVEM